MCDAKIQVETANLSGGDENPKHGFMQMGQEGKAVGR